jgi:hypothetical protein
MKAKPAEPTFAPCLNVRVLFKAKTGCPVLIRGMDAAQSKRVATARLNRKRFSFYG